MSEFDAEVKDMDKLMSKLVDVMCKMDGVVKDGLVDVIRDVYTEWEHYTKDALASVEEANSDD